MQSSNRPLIVELAGPAGSGKTTITKLLVAKGLNMRVRHQPYFGVNKDLPFFIYGLIMISPLLLKLLVAGIAFKIDRRHYAFMIILDRWHQIIHRKGDTNSFILVDQGPIFFMTFLKVFGSEYLQKELPFLQKWWGEKYDQWSKTVDIVIHLDADDNALMARVRKRNRPHSVIKRTDESAMEYYQHYRAVFHEVLHSFSSQQEQPRIIRIDTSSEEPGEIADRISEILVQSINTSQA